jgi:pyrroline-5-carboxylate reductase
MPYQGSGKAYVFYFIQAMIKVAVDLGFNESEAELLVNQIFMGSVAIKTVIHYLTKDELPK